MLIPGPWGFIRRAEAGPGGAAVSLFVSAPFHQLTGQERQAEESDSIPVRVQQLLHLHSGAGRTSHNVENNTSTLSRLSMLCQMVPR